MIRLFQKTYDGESIYDIPEDVKEAFNPTYNAVMVAIPTDEYGFNTGKFKVTIEWTDG